MDGRMKCFGPLWAVFFGLLWTTKRPLWLNMNHDGSDHNGEQQKFTNDPGKDLVGHGMDYYGPNVLGLISQ